MVGVFAADIAAVALFVAERVLHCTSRALFIARVSTGIVLGGATPEANGADILSHQNLIVVVEGECSMLVLWRGFIVMDATCRVLRLQADMNKGKHYDLSEKG